MKIVGTAKGKAPKAWSLMKNTVTGHYYVGWDGDWPVNGNHEAVNLKAKEARDTLPPEPDLGDDVQWPGFHIHCRPAHAVPLTQEQLDQYEAYDASNKRKYAHSQWLRQQEISQVEALDYTPVFEDELRFVGYTRGRSSVTMQFEASNGQIIEFGPSGINGLIAGIIDGQVPNVTLTGTYDEDVWNGKDYDTVTKPRGKGIKARFKFAKKGANTYAELTED